jgi:drug/metabolite transporter (DMT)-like permease
MTVRAILCLVGGVVLFALMDGVSKLLTAGYPTAQLVWARYAFAVPVLLVANPVGAWPSLLSSERPALQVGRALLPLLANTTAVLALAVLPLADATAITFVYPLLTVALAVPLLGERVEARAWLGVLLGFVGILVIVRPGGGALAWAALLPLATAFTFALYQVLTRLVSRADPPMVTLAWTLAVGLVATSSVLTLAWQPPSGRDWLLLAVSGVLFGLGQLLLIRAFASAPAAVLAPFSYVQIIAAVVFGALLFGHWPDLATVGGAVLIVLAGLLVLPRQGAAA